MSALFNYKYYFTYHFYIYDKYMLNVDESNVMITSLSMNNFHLLI